MGQVIKLNFSQSEQTPAEKQTNLARTFAKKRRIEDDAFWLKENAEFLNIHATSGAYFEPNALGPYEAFYAEAAERLRFFPQYYRFLLSITLDLEDLGMEGAQGEALCAWASKQELANAELSDLQRAEAQLLLSRRGHGSCMPELTDRLHGFINMSATFALPNKKAAYELVHIVFYLSEYGRKDPLVKPVALESLRYAGTIAFLDENADLLAEICAALQFAGAKVPAVWKAWLHGTLARYRLEPCLDACADDYHEYLVCNWLEMLASHSSIFAQEIPEGPFAFLRPEPRYGLLRALSEALYELPPQNRDNWSVIKQRLCGRIGAKAMAHLALAEVALGDFEGFFVRFARGAA